MKQLHEIQLKILRKLIFSEGLQFSKLKPDKNIENNQFDWHLKQLIKSGYIEQQGMYYKLTVEGRKYCNRMDTNIAQVVMQGKISALMVCLRNTNGYNEFLMYTRKKHPFYNCQGFASGKVKWGETVKEAAERELNEETGFRGKCEIINLWHYLVTDDKSDINEDKYFFICRFVNPYGELQPVNEEGLYEWVKQDDLIKWIKKPFTDINEILTLVKYATTIESSLPFLEMKIQNDKF